MIRDRNSYLKAQKKQSMREATYWVYLLRCSNGSLYAGYTTDMARRYQEHVNGTAKSKYTRSFKPLHIAQCWVIENCKSTAMKMESFIKTLSKKEKENLILSLKESEKLFLCRVVESTFIADIERKIGAC